MKANGSIQGSHTHKHTHTHRASSSGGVEGDLWHLKIVLETHVTPASYRSCDSD